MASVAVYNNLPSLIDADESFVSRDKVFDGLLELFLRYDYKWGLCLVHSHCKLVDDEIMLAQGDTSQPIRRSNAPGHYSAERWLRDGTPYEFTLDPTEDPPTELIEEFRRLTEDHPALGLFYAGKQPQSDDPCLIERTEGRANIIGPMSEALGPNDILETAWLPGGSVPVRMRCVIVCDSRTTRGSSVHKGTRSH